MRAQVFVIAVGIFVTGLGSPVIIGRLPIGLYLKNQLGLAPHQVSAFWTVTMLAWYVKPLVGLICDAYPLFGRRRAGYLAAGTIVAGLLWLASARVPGGYAPLMAVMTALVAALAFVSAAVGGMLVETGQRHGASGRLSSLRQALVGIISLVAGPLGAWLAVRSLGWTAAAGALVLLSYLPVLALLHREPRGARPDAAVWRVAARQLGAIARSRQMWVAAGLLFVVYLAPGLQTALLYYQQDTLGFTPQLMGRLQFLGGAGALVGAAAYAVACRYIPLRRSLALGVLLNTASTLFYLGYASPLSAKVITVNAAVVGTLAMLPLYDLAVRATPKGSESLGFALLMSVQTLAMYASDVLGAGLYERFHFGWRQLVWVDAAWTAAVLLYLPLLPRALVAEREGPSP